MDKKSRKRRQSYRDEWKIGSVSFSLLAALGVFEKSAPQQNDGRQWGEAAAEENIERVRAGEGVTVQEEGDPIRNPSGKTVQR